MSVHGQHAYDSHNTGLDAFDITDVAYTFEFRFTGGPSPGCGYQSHTMKGDPSSGTGLILNVPATTTGDCDSGFDLAHFDLNAPGSHTVTRASYPTGTTSCRQFGLVDGPNHHQVAALCREDGWDVAQVWSDPWNPAVTGRRWAPSGRQWHSVAFSGDGEVLALGDNMRSVYFYDPDDLDALLARITIPERGSGPGSQGCTVAFVPQSPESETRFVLAACGREGLSILQFNGGASPSVEEFGFFTTGGADARSAFWYLDHIYMTDRNSGLFVLKDRGGRIGRNPRTGEMTRLTRSNPRSAPN